MWLENPWYSRNWLKFTLVIYRRMLPQHNFLRSSLLISFQTSRPHFKHTFIPSCLTSDYPFPIFLKHINHTFQAIGFLHLHILDLGSAPDRIQWPNKQLCKKGTAFAKTVKTGCLIPLSSCSTSRLFFFLLQKPDISWIIVLKMHSACESFK